MHLHICFFSALFIFNYVLASISKFIPFYNGFQFFEEIVYFDTSLFCINFVLGVDGIGLYFLLLIS